jgi:Tfp pilus assembly protein PilN
MWECLGKNIYPVIETLKFPKKFTQKWLMFNFIVLVAVVVVVVSYLHADSAQWPIQNTKQQNGNKNDQ